MPPCFLPSWSIRSATGCGSATNRRSTRSFFPIPIYLRTLVNTVVFLGIGVNLHLFLALLLSGFFLHKGWWVKALLLVFILPWAAPAIPTFISIHWMLNSQ